MILQNGKVPERPDLSRPTYTPPLDRWCPACHVLPGKPCHWSEWSFATPHPEFHSERTR